MTTTLKSYLKKLPEKYQKKIKKRAGDLISQEMTLRNIRKTLEFTQTDVSSKSGMNQETISRLERRSDLLLSTLISYIEAMGGRLNLTATFPNRPPIHLTGFEGAGLKNKS